MPPTQLSRLNGHTLSAPPQASVPHPSIPLHHPAPIDSSALSRPKSSSSLAAARQGHAPYMVALSGWPEPVYIDSSRSEWDRKRSHPGTPRQTFAGEVRDGVAVDIPRGGSPVGTGSTRASPSSKGRTSPQIHGTGTRSPKRVSTPPSDSPSPFPTSSARSSALDQDFDIHSVATSFSSQQLSTAPLSQNPSQASRAPTSGPRQGHFLDPRLAPHVAVLHNRGALQVVPAWSSPPPLARGPTSPLAPPAAPPYSGPSPHAVSQGVKVTAGSRGTGILVMRAVPDVYPLPSAATSPFEGVQQGTQGHEYACEGGFAGQFTRLGMGMATEVYPRDPESGFLWGGGEGMSPVSISGMGSGGVTSAGEGMGEENMDIDKVG